jgi:uncharacterized Rmd1/YagE family protein
LKKTDPFGSGFISLKPEKTKPTKNRKNRIKSGKTEPNQKNRAKPVFVRKNQTETDQFESVSVFFFKFGLVTFFYKNRTEPKMIISSHW